MKITARPVLSPSISGRFISENAEHVNIIYGGAKKLADEVVEKVTSGELSIDLFSQASIHPKSTDPWAIDWLFVVDTLNFCFWSKENETGWTVDGYTGYYALCSAINRAMRENVDILNPKFYFTINSQQAESIFRSDSGVSIPLFEERIKLLHEVGNVLLEKFEGSFMNVVKLAENSAVRLLQLIVGQFSCFRDEADYKGKKVAIYKRAQILVGDIWACFKGQGVGWFGDIDCITMFADYRVPQSLLDFGVIQYSQELLDRLKAGELIPNGDEMEVEIRGTSIHAVRMVADLANKALPNGKQVNCILLDHFLWDYRREHAKDILEKGLPFHKSHCIYY